MSDPNLVVRLLREQREELRKMTGRLDAIEVRLTSVDSRLTTLEHAVGSMATQLFAVTGMLKDHDRRIRKLQPRPAK